jgi:hypothetical protein
MTSPRPDFTPIPLTDDLGDLLTLLPPERDPVTGEPVAAALQRAAKSSPVAARTAATGRPRPRPKPQPQPQQSKPPRKVRRLGWPLPVGVVAMIFGAALTVWAVVRDGSPSSGGGSTPTATVVETTSAPVTTVVGEGAVPVGPLQGFDGTYQLTAENLHVSAANPPHARDTSRFEPAGDAVTVRYDGVKGPASATIALAIGPAKLSCASDGWTCTVQWAGPYPVAVDGHPGTPRLKRVDETPLDRGVCGLPMPSNGDLTKIKLGLVNERTQVQGFSFTLGAAVDTTGCANAVVIAYDLTALRTP